MNAWYSKLFIHNHARRAFKYQKNLFQLRCIQMDAAFQNNEKNNSIILLFPQGYESLKSHCSKDCILLNIRHFGPFFDKQQFCYPFPVSDYSRHILSILIDS